MQRRAAFKLCYATSFFLTGASVRAAAAEKFAAAGCLRCTNYSEVVPDSRCQQV